MEARRRALRACAQFTYGSEARPCITRQESRMTDEKPPDAVADTSVPATKPGEAPAQSTADTQPEAVDQMLQELMDDTDKAALYHLLSVC
jgi:hypothetical protein